jgi:hypothetical protein
MTLGPVGQRRALAVRLAALAGRRLDDAAAYVDAVLPGGVRLHAILPPSVAGVPTSPCGCRRGAVHGGRVGRCGDGAGGLGG